MGSLIFLHRIQMRSATPLADYTISGATSDSSFMMVARIGSKGADTPAGHSDIKAILLHDPPSIPTVPKSLTIMTIFLPVFYN